MGRKQFYWDCIKFAFSGGWGIADIVSFVLAILAGLVVWLWEPLGELMNILVWAIPLAVFVAVVAVRLILAPYHLYKKQVDEVKRLTELVGSKDSPKLPSPPELYLEYPNSKVEIENDVHIVTISAWYRITTVGKMRISQVELHLIGKVIPPLNWEIIDVSQELWYGPDTKFKLPEGISSGEHNAELFAFANGQWWGPYAFTISVPAVKR